MKERNGVRVGQRVRDLDGSDLGRVKALHDGSFRVSKGALLFRRDVVARYDEVRGVRDGALVLARSARDLDVLAAGGLPPSWRIPAPPGFPQAATPAEARLVFDDLAAGAIVPAGGAFEPAPAPPPTAAPPAAPAPTAPRSAEEERRYAQARGPAAPGAPTHR